METQFDHIDMDPKQEDIDAYISILQKEEKNYPIPPQPIFLFRFLRFILFFLTNSPALILFALRLPFILIRKLKIEYLKIKARKQFKENYEWDPDNWREFSFSPPQRRPTPSEKKFKKAAEGHRDQMAKAKNDWLTQKENPNLIIDYCVYLTGFEHVAGAKKGLFILHQLETAPRHRDLKYGLLFKNMSFMLTRINLNRTARKYSMMAIQEDPSLKPQRSFKSFYILIIVAWQGLQSDLVNVWPTMRDLG